MITEWRTEGGGPGVSSRVADNGADLQWRTYGWNLGGGPRVSDLGWQTWVGAWRIYTGRHRVAALGSWLT